MQHGLLGRTHLWAALISSLSTHSDSCLQDKGLLLSQDGHWRGLKASEILVGNMLCMIHRWVQEEDCQGRHAYATCSPEHPHTSSGVSCHSHSCGVLQKFVVSQTLAVHYTAVKGGQVQKSIGSHARDVTALAEGHRLVQIHGCKCAWLSLLSEHCCKPAC